jgi:hypothetical protein
MTHLGRWTLAGIVTAAALATPAAALGQSPEPTPDQPSCDGLIVASFNHGSGADGPSGNPVASSGPGSFFGPGTYDAIVTLAREPNCTQ